MSELTRQEAFDQLHAILDDLEDHKLEDIEKRNPTWVRRQARRARVLVDKIWDMRN